MFKNYSQSKLPVRAGGIIFCFFVLSIAVHGQQLQWFNYPGYFPHQMATDAQGNVYVTGRDKSTNNGQSVNVFIRKYAPSGALIWERLSTDQCCKFRTGQSIALDQQGNVYVAGDFFSDIKFDTVELQSSYSDVFLVKYTADGTLLWARSAYSSTEFEGQEFVSDLEIDASNNPVIIGNFEREMRLDSTLIVAADDAPPNKMSVYMLRANADGVWQSLQRVNLHYAYALEVDAAGNLFVAGSNRTHTHEHYYTDPQEGDIDTLFIDMFDMGIAKYNATGALQWRNLYGAPTLVEGIRDMALDDAGNVYVAGNDNDPLAPRTAPVRHAVFMKTDNNGVQQWVRTCQNINYAPGDIASFGNVAVDNDQNPVFAGVFKGTVAVGSQNFTSTSGSDLLFIRYDASGTLASALPFSGTGDDDLVDMVFNADNDLYLTGFIPPPPAAPAISAFALIDAVTDQQDGLILHHGVVDLAALPNKHINVRAIMKSETAGSVAFLLNNREARIDNTAPFALYGDNGGDYRGKILPVGDYTLSATAWTEANASGAKGPTYTIHFKVINSAAAPWAAGVAVYPNPTQSYVRMSAAEAPGEDVSIQIHDLYGQLKHEGKWKAGEVEKEIDLTSLPRGVYVLKTTSGAGESIRRILKE